MLLTPPDLNAKPLDEGTLSVETEMADQNWPGKAKCPPRVAQPTNGGTQEGRSNAQSDPQISPEKKMVSGLAGPTAQGSDPALLSGPAPKTRALGGPEKHTVFHHLSQRVDRNSLSTASLP